MKEGEGERNKKGIKGVIRNRGAREGRRGERNRGVREGGERKRGKARD